MNTKDYYLVLEIEKGAGPQEIKEAYRKLALQYHPDRNEGDPAAVEKMKEINEAYAVLSDTEKRARYDMLAEQYGASAHDRFRQAYSEQDIFRNSDIGQIFEEMARSFGVRGFEEVFRDHGVCRTREFRGPGIFGKVIIFGPGMGWGGQRGARREVPHGNHAGRELAGQPGILARAVGALGRYAMKRLMGVGQGGDMHDRLTLDDGEAGRGGRVEYLDRMGRRLAITIPAGIKDGQSVRLRGMGQGGGDLYLKIEVKRSIVKKVKELLKI